MLGMSLLFALFGGIHLAEALITREFGVANGIRLGVDVLFLVLSAAGGNYLWQAGRILDRRRNHDKAG
jgi:hypothetical protein